MLIMATVANSLQQASYNHNNSNSSPTIACPTGAVATVPASPKLNQVLKSESVRRLFNQPNIVIHAIPRTNSPTAFKMVRSSDCNNSNSSTYTADKTNSSSSNAPHDKDHQQDSLAASSAKPEVSIRVIESTNETENLLPSKNNGKSEILLVPVVRQRKECGHFEPCESLLCLVNVEEFKDVDGLVTPLVAFNIDECEDINTKVDKHCGNNECDALSIDHDKGKVTSVEMHCWEKSSLCDVCGIAFLGDEIRLDHRKCRRKHVYQHNTATPTEVFKYRMRQKELQMIEAAKTKRSSDYLDPVVGLTKTMEALSKNDELIIIPKMPPFPPKIVKPCLLPLSSSHKDFYIGNNGFINKSIINRNNNNNNTNKHKSQKIIKRRRRKRRKKTDDKDMTSEKICNIIESCKQRIELESKQHNSETNSNNSVEGSRSVDQAQIDVSNRNSINHKSANVSIKEKSVDLRNSNFTAQEEFMANAGLQLASVNNVKSTDISELNPENEVKAELKKINDMSLPDKTYKVVPILQLKSIPSLLHEKQDSPTFCAENRSEDNSPEKTVATELKKPNVLKIKMKNEESKNNENESKKNPEEEKSPKEKNAHSEKRNKEDKELGTPAKDETCMEREKERSTASLLLPLPLSPKFSGLVKSNQHPAKKLLLNSDNSIDISTSNFDRRQVSLLKKAKGTKKPMKRLRFRCTHCSKCFTSLEYCRQHIAQHENKPDFFCRLCGRGFVSKFAMKKHQNSEHTAGEVRCEMCNKVLSSLSKLAEHLKRPNSKERQKCTDCQENFDSCGSLDLHMRKQHGFLICMMCKRQITKSKMMRHLMLEHGISKRRSESGFEKMTLRPGENDPIKDFDLSKNEAATESNNNNKNSSGKQEEMARRSSSRRRSSKEFFVCQVCERRFDSEKQYQIHVANYPMRFTPCLDCGKKFHRKIEYTEHSKTCNPSRFKEFNKAESMRKKRKSNLPSGDIVSASDNLSRNSIDQKQNESSEISDCKKFKGKENVTEEIIVQEDDEKVEDEELETSNEFEGFEEYVEPVREDDDDATEDFVEDKASDSKIVIETKIVNGLERNSSDCLETLDVVEAKHYVQIKNNDERASLLNDKQLKTSSAKTVAFNASAALSSIIQDHNYQVLK
ncbi:uncharacterized protein LOC106645037 [Copidosoma floridanum]|uniref:uncharacterized protein LOC106645037 n=1 Tax=Copidosoma floridanum TaxID=29053 RepID=UPI0006C97A5B|nr:uncharacterized protein LOC106645037 [Copidosoma floridanum]